MLNEWLTRGAILTTKNTELEEIRKIIGAYIQGRMRSHTNADTVDTENENALRDAMELNNFSHRSALPDPVLSIKRVYCYASF